MLHEEIPFPVVAGRAFGNQRQGASPKFVAQFIVRIRLRPDFDRYNPGMSLYSAELIPRNQGAS